MEDYSLSPTASVDNATVVRQRLEAVVKGARRHCGQLIVAEEELLCKSSLPKMEIIEQNGGLDRPSQTAPNWIKHTVHLRKNKIQKHQFKKLFLFCPIIVCNKKL